MGPITGGSYEVFENGLQEYYVFGDEVAVGKKVATSAAAGNSETAKRRVSVGSASETLSGADSAMQERHRVVKNCLSDRDYLILNY